MARSRMHRRVSSTINSSHDEGTIRDPNADGSLLIFPLLPRYCSPSLSSGAGSSSFESRDPCPGSHPSTSWWRHSCTLCLSWSALP